MFFELPDNAGIRKHLILLDPFRVIAATVHKQSFISESIAVIALSRLYFDGANESKTPESKTKKDVFLT